MQWSPALTIKTALLSLQVGWQQGSEGSALKLSLEVLWGGVKLNPPQDHKAWYGRGKAKHSSQTFSCLAHAHNLRMRCRSFACIPVVHLHLCTFSSAHLSTQHLHVLNCMCAGAAVIPPAG